jgi:antitoxin (DNA-binding transcriptional repressor) of toxin-antitoxin stability system
MTYNHSMVRMTVSQARAQMKEALEKVKGGEEVEITQNGEVVAVWVHPSKRRPVVRTPGTRLAGRLHEELDRGRQERPKVSSSAMTVQRAEELIEQIRSARDEAQSG